MKASKMSRQLLAVLIAGMGVPLAARAADDELLRRIESLSREIEQLKSQVQANEAKQAASAEAVKRVEDKSLGKWLTLGGEFRFRYDRLRGETRTFTDANATFQNAQQFLQGQFFANPSVATGGALTGLAQFAQGMSAVQTVDQARAFLGNPGNQAMLQGLGGFAAIVPAYKPKNSSLLTNRMALDLNAKALQNVSFTARLAMTKTFGAQDDAAIVNSGAAPFFADRVGVFDGTLGHIPSSSYAAVDRVYATWSNIAERDMWFSVGRRPTTAGAESHLRLNNPAPGNGGVPSLLIDYAFDGMTLGYAPDIDALPGAYGKFCYGRGFESGYRNTPGNSIKDTDMVGISLVPIDTDNLRAWIQWNRGMNIFDAPAMTGTYFGNTMPRTNLGDIDWLGAGVLKAFKGVGPGTLNVFADAAMSRTHPNQNVSAQFGFQGLLTGGFFQPEAPSGKTGSAFAIGMRYDLPAGTKLGLEFNHGSKNWITFAPAADDMWTSKAGVRGNVYEAYVIQEIKGAPVASFKSKAFFKLGARYYDFRYTGSNNWVGAPVRISDVNGQMSALTPLSKAYDLYATFELKF